MERMSEGRNARFDVYSCIWTSDILSGCCIQQLWRLFCAQCKKILRQFRNPGFQLLLCRALSGLCLLHAALSSCFVCGCGCVRACVRACQLIPFATLAGKNLIYLYTDIFLGHLKDLIHEKEGQRICYCSCSFAGGSIAPFCWREHYTIDLPPIGWTLVHCSIASQRITKFPNDAGN